MQTAFITPAQLTTAPAQLITAPVQPPATGAAVYTALFLFWECVQSMSSLTENANTMEMISGASIVL